ncbi:MAG: hypothetical protein O4859_13215, partial [Trichodesmium sp. St18_bin1]|nr:hypothetical protein [Trichodesmium sp. St18_bin1]
LSNRRSLGTKYKIYLYNTHQPKKIKPKKFKKLFGVNIKTFNLLVKIVKEGEKSKKKMEKLRLGACLGDKPI